MSSEWKEIRLSDFVFLRHGYQFRDTDFTDVGIPIIKISNVWDKGLDLENVTFISSDRLNEFKGVLIKNGDILMSLTGNIGRVVEVKNLSINVLQNYRVGNFFTRDENILNRPYIKWILSSEVILNQLDRYSNQSAQANFGKQDLDKLRIKIPPKPQQTKIAKILTTIDNVIEKTEEAIAKYEAIKQGMMHDLFTRGIGEDGQLRPSFEDAPELYKESALGWIPKEWEVKELAEVCENLDGQRKPIKKEDRFIMKGNIPYYGASGIIDYVNDYIFREPLILLGEDGENVVSRNLPLAFKITGKSWINNHAHVLKPMEGNNIDYLTEYLESLDYTDIVSGSAQPKINQANLNKKLLKTPLEYEQDLIAERLKNISSKIEIEKNVMSKQIQLKKGLMQDLLTGKVVVNY